MNAGSIPSATRPRASSGAPPIRYRPTPALPAPCQAFPARPKQLLGVGTLVGIDMHLAARLLRRSTAPAGGIDVDIVDLRSAGQRPEPQSNVCGAAAQC